ncbi:MAG: DUF402 domain-containing protein [Salinibacterium sp.]|nr:DUF402 domain-containing protein [Salinibacterium sp.]
MPEVVNLRWMHEAHVESAHPVFLLHDSADVIVTFELSQSVGMHSTRPKGGPRGRNLEPGTVHTGFASGVWTGDGVARVHRRGEPWSTWRWLGRGRAWSTAWYVNLEEPWLRSSAGFDTEDWILDVVVADDGASWRYKDEDELEWAAVSGRFSAEQITRIMQAGTDAVAMVERRTWPFDADWDDWLPPEHLSVPTLQPGWDEPR